MAAAFPIIRRPEPGRRMPILVSVPHYGTEPLPHITRDDYSEPWFETFAYGYADTFASDLYSDLHEHGATVLATPFSRMSVAVTTSITWMARCAPGAGWCAPTRSAMPRSSRVRSGSPTSRRAWRRSTI